MLENVQDLNPLPQGGASTPPALSPPLPQPRVWTALVAGLIGMIAPALVGGIVVAAALFATGGPQQIEKAGGFMEWMTEFAATSTGMLVLVLPPQLTMLGCALLLAKLSPQPLHLRLGFVRSDLPRWSLPVLMLATPLFGYLGQELMTRTVGGASEQLEMIGNMAGSQTGFFAVMAFVLLGVLPPVAEETFFRGYVQRRLLECWHPLASICATTLLFAAAHFDPGHFVAVLPLGLWLGVVAWRAGSMWPAMLCHAAQNMLFVLVTQLVGYDAEQEPTGQELLAFLALPIVAALVSAWVLWRFPRATRA